MFLNWRAETVLQIHGEGGRDWLIVAILLAITLLALLWLFQRFHPERRRRRATGLDLDQQRQEQHTTGGPTGGAKRRRWNPR